mmetsp:Transcript_21943/g.26879  ORF Transcript_21943/g.26879 Transcript_21943/m.26879 type:complete len:242 (+) Transcript_21943:212-937(+)
MGGYNSKSSSTSSSSKHTSKTNTISAIDRAVLDLKNSRDRLTRFKTKVNADSDKLLLKAKQYHIATNNASSSNNNKTAVNLLKLRKLKLKEIDTINDQLLTIQSMISNIQNKEQEKQVLVALRTGKDALQKLHEETTLEDVMELMDQVDEQNLLEQQMNEIMGQIGEELTQGEEDDLEEELMALVNTANVNVNVNVNVSVSEKEKETLELPQVPNQPLPEQPQPVLAAAAPAVAARVPLAS